MITVLHCCVNSTVTEAGMQHSGQNCLLLILVREELKNILDISRAFVCWQLGKQSNIHSLFLLKCVCDVDPSAAAVRILCGTLIRLRDAPHRSWLKRYPTSAVPSHLTKKVPPLLGDKDKTTLYSVYDYYWAEQAPYQQYFISLKLIRFCRVLNMVQR